MRKHLSIVAAAAMAAGTIGFTSQWAGAQATDNQVQNSANRAADDTNRAADKTGNAVERTGDKIERAADKAGDKAENAMKGQGLKGTAAAPDAEGIRDVLASSTEAAFTRGGFDDLVERFVDADRNRVGKFADQDHPDLDAKIGTFLQAWKAKYNQDFDINNEELVFTDKVSIIQGEQLGQARLAGEKVDADVDANTTRTPAGGTRTDVNVNVQNNTGVDSPNKPAADTNRNDAGRNIATVTIPASHGLPQTKVPMVHEFPDAWKIDLPDNVDGPKLKANLAQAMDKVLAQQNQWPADVNEAYLAVSHQVLNALVGQGQQGQPGQNAPGATGTQTR
jgi:hypothetical protein